MGLRPAKLALSFLPVGQQVQTRRAKVTRIMRQQVQKLMPDFSHLEMLSRAAESILRPPFEWCYVQGGDVILEDATRDGGIKGGVFQIGDFAIAKYPITNAQYETFLKQQDGFSKTQWREYSSTAIQWHKDHKNPKPTAFNGSDLPRTRVSWFDSMAFSFWLSAELKSKLQDDKPLNIHDVSTWIVRLPTEQEWQRAALSDTGWCHPWGNVLVDETRGNYGKKIGQPSNVDKYPEGKSIYGVMDLTGNVWERCVTGWNQEIIDVSGYTYRVFKGGAWNVSNPDHLRSNDRGCHSPRGQLNDCGFRVLLRLGSL